MRNTEPGQYRALEIGHVLYIYRCAPASDIFPDARGKGKPTARTFPAALKLRIKVFGKPRKSKSKADALSRYRSVRGPIECSGDNECSAPAHNNVYNAWPGKS